MMNLDGEILVRPYNGQSLVSLFAQNIQPCMVDFRTSQNRGELNQAAHIHDAPNGAKIITVKNFTLNDKRDITLERSIVYHVQNEIGTYVPEDIAEHFRYIFYSKINWCIDHCLTQGAEGLIAIAMTNAFLNVGFIVTKTADGNIIDFELFLFPVESDLMKNVFNAIKGN